MRLSVMTGREDVAYGLGCVASSVVICGALLCMSHNTRYVSPAKKPLILSRSSCDTRVLEFHRTKVVPLRRKYESGSRGSWVIRRGFLLMVVASGVWR